MTTTLKGIFPDPKPVRRKNFIHENMKSLKQMEQCFHASKQMGELQKLQLHQHRRTTTDKYQNVSAKVASNFQDNRHQSDNIIVLKDNVDTVSNDKKDEEHAHLETNAFESDKKHIVPAKKIVASRKSNDMLERQNKQNRVNKRSSQKMQSQASSEPYVAHKITNVANNTNTQNIIKYKNQGIQTLDKDQIENIYSEGFIRYPSKSITKRDEVTNNGELNQEEEKGSKKESDSPTDRGDMRNSKPEQKSILSNSVLSTPKEEVDFIKLNKERTSIANKLAMQLNNGVPPPNYRKGVVPKYLRDRKIAQQKEQKAREEACHPDCPEGHITLPDNERKETLQLLKKNYQDYVNELNKMPIKTDTLRAQRRKMEIEKQLNKLEEGIKIFSRPKVYVKIDA